MRRNRVAYGDWQTPPELADRIVWKLAASGLRPRWVVEPTCGVGEFLVAARHPFRQARLLGFDRNRSYVDAASARVPGARIRQADFFDMDWRSEFSSLDGPILVLGNPPWVTVSRLGAIGANNAPERSNEKGLSGYDALTGKSNFDVSEWMILRLLESLAGRDAALAMLCKSTVARNVLAFDGGHRFGIVPGGLWCIRAQEHFGAAVDAVLFVCKLGTSESPRTWPVFSDLRAAQPASKIAQACGSLVADPEKYARTLHLGGLCRPGWRSGLKHDCAPVMELRWDAGALRNGLGEVVSIEDEFVFPLLKSSDVANGRPRSDRLVVVPQRAWKEDTTLLQQSAPGLWAYLSRHAERLAARKSSIYRNQAPFSVFGLGPYSFSAYKVATSGLYKRQRFTLIEPVRGKPVMLDDTCYFLPFDDGTEAELALLALRSQAAEDFYSARIFWDAKRPINKTILQALDLVKLQSELGLRTSPNQLRQA